MRSANILTIDRSFRNPKIENIKDLLKKFSDEWGKKIDSIEENNKIALDSIVNNKNAIAHGRNCTVTYNEIKNYHERSKVVLKEINKIIVS